MLLEALVPHDFSNFNMHENVCSSQHSIHDHNGGFLLPNDASFANLRPLDLHGPLDPSSSMPSRRFKSTIASDAASNRSTRGRKRSRRPRVCKNKEEAETQRMTHINVERNRRKQMNEYLAILRSLMPESYTHRGDQASIVGGAIEYVKELEQLVQSLEAENRILKQKEGTDESSNNFFPPPFSQFFTCPQFSWCQVPGDNPLESRTAIADIQVTVVESHANLRILSRRRPRQLFKIIAGFHTLQLTILHLNVTTLDSLVLYSFSVKIEEGCYLNSVDDIANAVHHMVRIIEEEADLA
ncbi:hypothetical protein IFM89_032789 [Coptis chinensis]|uniref:BHLH domain-containing protein n=1 Tax=Coptis chinensis TaxID=261450 RepID=A0A835IZJ2_9MAGN|nr:hypothetical protein IFM89_032789 [Coptis chinensis]